jgi:hypothetical protein
MVDLEKLKTSFIIHCIKRNSSGVTQVCIGYLIKAMKTETLTRFSLLKVSLKESVNFYLEKEI